MKQETETVEPIRATVREVAGFVVDCPKCGAPAGRFSFADGGDPDEDPPPPIDQ